MKVIIDTNVFISGVFWSGAPAKILQLWRKGTLQLVLSNDILEEYHRVVSEISTKFSDIDISEIMTLLIKTAVVCDTKRFKKQVCTDPDDDMFLECAVTNQIRYIVSGDKELLKTSGYKNISVLKPIDFLRLFPE